jgi:prepilin-type N-terminal cleavage/methylation domain-containing protein
MISPYKKIQHSKFNIHNSQSGFTLVEMLISVVIVGIIGYYFAAAFGGWSKSSLDNNYRLALQREVDLALSFISQDLQEATGADDSVANEITITTLGGGTVVFRFNTGTGALERTVGGNTRNIIHDYMGAGIVVDSLSFASNIVNIKQQITTTLALKFVDRGGYDEVVEFRTTTILRNS